MWFWATDLRLKSENSSMVEPFYKRIIHSLGDEVGGGMKKKNDKSERVIEDLYKPWVV